MDVSALSQLSGLMQSGTNSLTQTGSAASIDGTSMFKDLLDNMISNVNETDSSFQGDIVKAAEGELDNPHQLLIDGTKASIALQLLTSVRNNALSAYNDTIKMNI